MADKEERILITKCSGWCHALRISCDPFDDDDGMYCDKSGKWVRITEKECAKCKTSGRVRHATASEYLQQDCRESRPHARKNRAVLRPHT